MNANKASLQWTYLLWLELQLNNMSADCFLLHEHKAVHILDCSLLEMQPQRHQKYEEQKFGKELEAIRLL